MKSLVDLITDMQEAFGTEEREREYTMKLRSVYRSFANDHPEFSSKFKVTYSKIWLSALCYTIHDSYGQEIWIMDLDKEPAYDRFVYFRTVQINISQKNIRIGQVLAELIKSKESPDFLIGREIRYAVERRVHVWTTEETHEAAQDWLAKSREIGVH